jgi:c-di-GMP-binding flagellar brake protein YcgR
MIIAAVLGINAFLFRNKYITAVFPGGLGLQKALEKAEFSVAPPGGKVLNSLREFSWHTDMGKDQRRHKRYTVEGIRGTMLFAPDMRILNISIGGAAIETTKRLNPGSEYTLKLEDVGKTLTIKGVIAWSVISQGSKGPRGEFVPMYRAGIQFTNIMTENTARLIEFIEGHKKVDEARLCGLRVNIDSPHRAALDFPYKVKKISMGGMQIETEQPLAADERFQMEVLLEEDKAIQFVGRIAHCNEVEEGRYTTGIEFVEMAEGNKQTLIQYIQGLFE